MQVSIEALDGLALLINNRLPERDKRILLGAAAKAYGHGGEKRVNDLAGAAFSTLHRGRMTRGRNQTKQEQIKALMKTRQLQKMRNSRSNILGVS